MVEIRKLAIRHLFLPRPYFLRNRWFSEKPNASGKFYAKQFISLPWYIEPTFWARNSPKAWLLRLVGGKAPGDDGNAYLPDGYVITELGPENLKHKGTTDMQSTRKRLEAKQPIGCPFARL